MDGMRAKMGILLKGKLTIVSLSPLEVLQVAASKAGFYDVDIVDNDIGSVKVVASRLNQIPVTAKGEDIESAVEKFLEIVLNEKVK
jgi:hypothetical protein